MKLIHPISCFLLLALSIPLFSHAETKPVPANGKLNILIVSGQSNMVGFGQLKGESQGAMETLVKNDPDDYDHLVDKKGNHWNRNWETLYLIGKGVGDALIEILPGK